MEYDIFRLTGGAPTLLISIRTRVATLVIGSALHVRRRIRMCRMHLLAPDSHLMLPRLRRKQSTSTLSVTTWPARPDSLFPTQLPEVWCSILQDKICTSQHQVD